MQKELGYKVQIFEKKVDSYKKTTQKLNNTVEYIKVKLQTNLPIFVIIHFVIQTSTVNKPDIPDSLILTSPTGSTTSQISNR